MRAPRLVLLLLLLSLAAPATVGNPAEGSRPMAAFAFVQPGGTFLTWTPAPTTPDYYVIYGVVGEDKSPISIAPPDATFAQLDAVFPQYAIAAVVGDSPSEATFAMTVVQDCIIIETTSTPPAVTLGNCGTGDGKVGVRIGLFGLP